MNTVYSDSDLKNKELQNCSYIKAIIMLIIVMNHCICIYALSNRGGWLPIPPHGKPPLVFELLNTWFASFMNSTFVMVSGYIYYAMKFERGKYQKYWPFIANKVKRLIVPTIFISVVWIIPICVYALEFTTPEIINSFALGIFPRQLWFLLMLFWVFVIFAIIDKIINKHFVLGALLVCGCYLFGKFGAKLTDGINYYRIFDGFQYIFFFWVGFCLRKYGIQYLIRMPVIIYLAFNIGTITLSRLIDNIELPHMLDTIKNIVIPPLVQLVGAMMAFVVLQKVLIQFKQGNKALDFFAKHSFTVFLVHEQLIYLAVIWYEGKISPYLFPIVTFAWVLPVSIGASLLLEKTRITRFLIGMK